MTACAFIESGREPGAERVDLEPTEAFGAQRARSA